MYDENVDYHNRENSNCKKEVTKADAFSLYSTESQSATSTENITKTNANPRVCPVLENGMLTAGQTFKTTASFNSREAELLYYRDEALKQTISANGLQSRDIFSVAFTEPAEHTLRPLIADGYGGDIAIIGDGGGSGVQPIETSVKTDVGYSQISSDGIEPFRVNSISDVEFTTIAIADGDIETASVNTKQTPDNIINNFDCVLVQEFGNSDNAQEFLDRTPYSEPQKGTIYLDQWGSDSDSFSMLRDLRNNPSSISQSLDNKHLYGKVEKISDNAVKRGSDDPYKIFTIHSSETSDRITASGYSGDSLASVSSEIYVEEAYGFSKIDFIENQKTRVNEGILDYGYVEDKRFFEVTGNNYITWEASTNDFVNVEIQTSTDNENWSNATNGDSIPNVYKTRERPKGLYLRAKLTRDEGIDYTPSLDKLEFLIDEASAKVLDGIKLDALIPTQITAFEQSVQSTIFEIDPFTDTFPITYKESFEPNTLEAIVKEADITGIPLEATHNPSKWKIINNDGEETKLGEVVKSNRTFDTLTLEVVASESKMNNIIRPMYVNSGKENTNILSSGIQRSLDQTDNNNTYELIPPYKSNPPFVPQKYTLKTYREKIDTNEGSRYNVKLVFKPKDPPEKDDEIFGDNLVRQERSPKQWLIEFRKGQIATRHIQAEIKSKSKYGVKLSRIQMIVSSHQSEAIVSNLIHNGATSVLKTDDGTSYILDSTHTNSNTITITPPGSGHEIESGEYVVDKWSIKSSGSDSTFIFRMYIAKS
jgi:hypothetical protein